MCHRVVTGDDLRASELTHRFAGPATQALAGRNVDSGQALLDGIPFAHLRRVDVRRAVTLVPQDASLLPTTIAANLRVARLDATDPELDAVPARAELVDEIADLPNGLKTALG